MRVWVALLVVVVGMIPVAPCEALRRWDGPILAGFTFESRLFVEEHRWGPQVFDGLTMAG